MGLYEGVDIRLLLFAMNKDGAPALNFGIVLPSNAYNRCQLQILICLGKMASYVMESSGSIKYVPQTESKKLCFKKPFSMAPAKVCRGPIQ